MPFFSDFSESTDPAGALAADPLQYIKGSLPAPTRACPLHVKGAWTALFKFFIGQPAEPGIFHKDARAAGHFPPRHRFRYRSGRKCTRSQRHSDSYHGTCNVQRDDSRNSFT
jgi:hypothetical protein